MRNYSNRQYIIGGFFCLIGIIFVIRLFSIQVLDDTYKTSSENNVIRKQTEYPGRGLIYDRNGELLVYNEAAYDLMNTAFGSYGEVNNGWSAEEVKGFIKIYSNQSIIFQNTHI